MNLSPFGKQQTNVFSSELTIELGRVVTGLSKENALQGKNTVVAICGGSCTGKSTQVTSALKEELGDQAVVFHQDAFQNNPSYQASFDETYRWDHPDNFDLRACEDALRGLVTNEVVVIPDYSFQTDEPIGTKTIAPRPIILFEGLYASFKQLLHFSDVVIYAEAPFHARLIRRIYRNTRERYKGRDQGAIVQGFVSSVTQAHRDFVCQQKVCAHLILRMPFHFSELIERFQLVPVAGRAIYDWSVSLGDDLTIGLNGSNHSFLLFYREEKYLEFTMDQLSFERLKELDWWRC
ncbi:MAG: hypothetical protein AAF551_11160 [Bacteroidota bacterium]